MTPWMVGLIVIEKSGARPTAVPVRLSQQCRTFTAAAMVVSEVCPGQCYNSGDKPGRYGALELGDAEVRHVARLARLRLTDEELGPVRNDLNRVLSYVSKLQELDLTSVEPTMHVVETRVPMRADVVGPSLPSSEAVANAPHAVDHMFAVPRIMDGGDDDE